MLWSIDFRTIFTHRRKGREGGSPPSCFEKFSGKTLMIRATAVEIKLKKKKSVIPKRQAKWTHAKSNFGVNQVLTDGGNLSITLIHSFPQWPSWVGIFEESFTSVWKLSECISVKIKSWIAESDFLFRDARVPRGKPSTCLQALLGENQNLTKTLMLLLRYRNQRIYYRVNTFFTFSL